MLVDAVRGLYYRIPDGFQRAVLVRRRQPIWLRTGIVFIHIPKAAGTAVNESLYGRFMGHVHATDIERWGSEELKALPSFAVTRNPWDRLVSAYRFVTRGHGVGGPNAGRVRRADRYRVPEFETFGTFVTEWLRGKDLRRLDVAFQPQCDFVCDSHGAVLVDHVGRLEDLEPTFAFLRERLPELRPISESNRSGDKVDYRDFYTPDLADLVGSIYSNDVMKFGYSFD
jgi:hypothetical protein